MTNIRRVCFAVLLAWPWLICAQEVKYIELNFAQQRTELRHPPAPAPKCNGGNCVSGGASGLSIGDGAPDRRDPHSLAVYLLRVHPTELPGSEPLEAEFKVENTGQAPFEVPIWADLSDLQPNNESASFTYFSIALVVAEETEPGRQTSSIPALGYIQLYGSHERAETLLTLKPGEWIRVKAVMKLQTWPQSPTFARLQAGFWLRKNTFRPQAGGGSTDMQNLYPNDVVTPSIPVHFLGSSPSGSGARR